jgi:hypothetical protein
MGDGMVEDIPDSSDAGGDEDGGYGCGEDEDGLGRGRDGSSGGEGNRGERDCWCQLVSGLFSLRSSSSHLLFLAFFLSMAVLLVTVFGLGTKEQLGEAYSVVMT